MINLTREEAQVPLVEQLESVPQDARLCIDDADGMGTHYFPIGNMCHEAAKVLRAKLSEPENEFNPDWNAMAVMVEEQQRMAKQIEELDIALAEQDAKYLDAIEILDDEGWTWDGDQWQRPATRSKKMREAGITRRPKGWSKEDEPEPVGWVDWDEHGNAFLTIKDCGVPLYTAPPQREWVGLTDEEILKLFGVNGTADSDRNALAVLKDAHKLLEAIKEKNYG